MNDLAKARLVASDLDLKAGRVRSGSYEQLMQDLLNGDESSD